MDYGFAPGETRDYKISQLERVRMLFDRRRANTQLVDELGIDSVRQFIQHLETDPGIPVPIGNALIGAHADSEGHIFIPMFAGQGDATDFEVLQQTIDEADKSIKLDAVIDTAGGHFVHFKGCNIGSVEKFLTKFKEALRASGVTAPKHFHGLTVDENAGVFEYMAYEFKVFNKAAFTSRAALVAAFRGRGFQFIDGTPIPPARWGEWVPNRFRSTNPKPKEQNFTLGMTVAGRTSIPLAREFRVSSMEKREYFWDFPPPDPFPAPAGYLAALRADIIASPKFAVAHPFPFHERLGYPNAPAFLDGMTWKITKGTGEEAGLLVGRGRRFEYTLLVPLVDPTTNHLFFNFHPNVGSAHARVTGLAESDTRFFGRV